MLQLPLIDGRENHTNPSPQKWKPSDRDPVGRLAQLLREVRDDDHDAGG